MQPTANLTPEVPRLLLMRWEGIEFWAPSLCERDRLRLNEVKSAIDDLKAAADLAACKAAFDHLAVVSRCVGNELRAFSGDKSQSQLWRARHIANLLEGIEDESTAASASADQWALFPGPTKEGHPALRPDARNLVR